MKLIKTIQTSVASDESPFAFAVDFIFTQFILPHTVIYISLLALFYTYYHLHRGGSFWLVLMLLFCLLLMPMLAGLQEGLAIGVLAGLVVSSWLTICLLWPCRITLSPMLLVALQCPRRRKRHQDTSRGIQHRLVSSL